MRKIAKELKFLIAEKEREEITLKQMKKIKKLYENAAKDFARNYKMLKGRDNISSVLRRQYIDEMQKDLSGEITKISKQVEKGIEGAILQTSESVVRDNQRMLSNMGFNIKKAFSYVPTDVVETITSGQLYQSDWTLSKAIWGDKKKTISDIHEVIAKGLIENKGSYDIAKDLEKYVDPNVAKDWDWSKVYPNTKRKVEYNAQRLARTLTSHAYQESFVRLTKDNPFINAYKWETSNSHTTCDLCIDRATQDKYGLGAGIFPKDALPLDHPNGKCIVVLNMEGSMSDVSDQIAEWYNSPEGTFPDVDKFANSFDKGSSVKQPVTKAKKEVAEKVEKNSTETDNIIPPTSTWISKIRKQTQTKMLAKEKQWLKMLDDDAIKALSSYTGSAYKQMNTYLRVLKNGLPESEAISISQIEPYNIKKLKDAIKGLDNIRIDEDLVLRRGTNFGDLAGAFMDGDFMKNAEMLKSKTIEELNEILVGEIGNYGSLTSTSSIWDKGFSGDLEVVIYAPKGTSASSVMSISKFGTSEGETLLNANTVVRCVKVEKSNGHKDSKVRAFLEVIVKNNKI